MNVIQLYTHSPLRNFTYLIGNDQQQYWCVDPFDGRAVADKLAQLGGSLVGIINTHEHDDHTCGNAELLRLTGASIVAGHPDCGEFIPGYTRALNAGDNIAIGDDYHLNVLDTPGHSRGHVCLLLEELTAVASARPVAVFSGDILFNAGVGHCRKEGGSVEQLYTTLSEQFHTLDDSVTVYPGHEYLVNNLQFCLSLEVDNQAAKQWLKKAEDHDWRAGNIVTTIADERLFNPFFRLDCGAIKASLALPEATQREVFIELRARRDNW